MRVQVQLHSSTLTFENLDATKRVPMQDLLCELERAVIGEMLKVHDGIKAKAAHQLMLNRTTLVEKARKYGFPLKK